MRLKREGMRIEEMIGSGTKDVSVLTSPPNTSEREWEHRPFFQSGSV